jgi:predicted dienelactone hydrolase
MRPLEILLLLVTSLALTALAVPLPRTLRWMRHAAPAAAGVAIAQALAEGPRWQMIPAYALAMAFVLVWMVRRFAPPGWRTAQSAPHPTLRTVAIGLGAMGLAIAVALPAAMPVFRFPPPDGPFGIGTFTYHWVDRSRPEIFALDPSERRQLMVQIWYPARANASASHAGYMPDADAVMAAFARIHGLPRFVFGHFKYVTTHAVPSAPAAADSARYPVLFFLEGATGFRQMSTFQVEHLVSHGFIVVAIDQPGAAAAVVFPDGHQSAGLALTQFHDMVSPSYMPVGADPSPKGPLRVNGRALDDRSIIPYLTKDVIFTLDKLALLTQSDPNGILTGRLDLQHVGAFGVSLGGIVVGEACRLDVRLRACLMMDAPMPADVVTAGLQQPSMWITRDAASMRLERQRSGGWSDAEIDAHQTSMRAVYEGLTGAGYFVRVPGMFHSNFTDIPIWTPLATRLGIAGPLDGQRAHEIVNGYSLAFFERHLMDRPGKLLDCPSPQYLEAIFESRRH